MNWLLWAADRLWEYYHRHEEKARAMESLKRTVAGVGFTLLSFLFGFCTFGLLLLSSFFFFVQQPRFSLAALWTALICSAFTLAVGLFGNKFFQRSLKV